MNHNAQQRRTARGRRGWASAAAVVATLMLGTATAWACTVSGGAPTRTSPTSADHTLNSGVKTISAWTWGGALLKPSTGGYKLHFANEDELVINDNCHDVGRLADEDVSGSGVTTDSNGDIPFNLRVNRTFTFTSADVGVGEMCWARVPAPDNADVAVSGAFTVT